MFPVPPLVRSTGQSSLNPILIVFVYSGLETRNLNSDVLQFAYDAESKKVEFPVHPDLSFSSVFERLQAHNYALFSPVVSTDLTLNSCSPQAMDVPSNTKRGSTLIQAATANIKSCQWSMFHPETPYHNDMAGTGLK